VIVIRDPSRDDGAAFRAVLLAAQVEILDCDHVAQALSLAEARRADAVVVSSSGASECEGLAAARRLRREHPRLPVILLAFPGSEDHAVAALRAGVSDYLKAPATPDELLASVERCCVASGRDETAGSSAGELTQLLGVSRAIEQVRAAIARVAATDTRVLITGETGTGKELVARLIHELGPRRKGPLVCLNCAAIPDNLLESELFGYERGAFTGAHGRYDGKFAMGQGGTVFLDEIGDMSSYAQAKILRIVETREVDRLGGRHSVPVDVRIVAATHEPLEKLVAEGRFRKDLFFRLNVARIHIPPLRERREDLDLLLERGRHEVNARLGSRLAGITPGARRCLTSYDWPGNVRELKNLLESLAVSLAEGTISEADLPDVFREARPAGVATPGLPGERDRLLSALRITNWNKSRAARQLHWSRMTLYRKIAKYQLARSEPARPQPV